MDEKFKDLQFRGTQWYLAEEVEERINLMEAQINLLKIDVEGLDKENRILMKKADAWDGWMESGKQTLDMLADINESIRNYCKNTLKLMEDFPNWTSSIRQEMKNILNLLDGGSSAWS